VNTACRFVLLAKLVASEAVQPDSASGGPLSSCELGLDEASSGPPGLICARYPYGGARLGIPTSVAPECLGDSKSRAGTHQSSNLQVHIKVHIHVIKLEPSGSSSRVARMVGLRPRRTY
jgi:hypothetical protein